MEQSQETNQESHCNMRCMRTVLAKVCFRQHIGQISALLLRLHIEQGQTLEMSGRDLGIVTSIAGQRRYLVTLEGECNHAGTTSMKWRKDPLAASSRIIHEPAAAVGGVAGGGSV